MSVVGAEWLGSFYHPVNISKLKTRNQGILCKSFAIHGNNSVVLCTKGAQGFLFSRGHQEEENVE